MFRLRLPRMVDHGTGLKTLVASVDCWICGLEADGL